MIWMSAPAPHLRKHIYQVLVVSLFSQTLILGFALRCHAGHTLEADSSLVSGEISIIHVSNKSGQEDDCRAQNTLGEQFFWIILVWERA